VNKNNEQAYQYCLVGTAYAPPNLNEQATRQCYTQTAIRPKTEHGECPKPNFNTKWSNTTTVALTTARFSQLLLGLDSTVTLSPAQRELGRKAWNPFLNLAIEHKLLRKREADWELDFDSAGANAIYYLELPLTLNLGHQTESLPLLIAKPRTYIENGWIAKLGSGYRERHLINLYLSQPELAKRPFAPADLAEILASFYQMSRQYLPTGFTGQPNFNINQLPTLQRRLGEAKASLQWRGLLSKTGYWQNAILETKLSATIPSTTPKISPVRDKVIKQLADYTQKDKLRTTRLISLWETGLLKEDELGLAWRTLPAFYPQAHFEHLLFTLGQRAKVKKEGRQLSWHEIETTARALRSQRGQRKQTEPLEGKQKLRKIECRHNNLVPPSANANPKIYSLVPKIKDFVADLRKLNRVRLEVKTNVANWRYYSKLPLVERPRPSLLKIKLLDAHGTLIFSDDSRQIEPDQATTQWSLALDQEFIKNWWRKQDFSKGQTPPVFYLEITQSESNSSDTNTNLTEPSGEWLAVSVCLSFFPRNYKA
jgi:hypothetical protein